MVFNPETTEGKPNYQLIALSVMMLVMMSVLVVFDQDEAAYAGFGLKMIETGNYLIPDFLWSEPHRKTPLHFWMIAGCFKLFGPTEFALRIPSALSLIGMWLSIWWLAPPLFGKIVSRNAGYLVMTSILALVYGGISFTDGPLMLFETIAALSILNLHRTITLKYILLLWLSVAAGGLTKGPPIFILSLGMVGLIWLSEILKLDKPIRDAPENASTPSFHLMLLWGLLICSASLPLLYWGYLCWQADQGVFITWLWDWYVTKRAGGAVWGQTGPPGYHLLIMAISFLPVLPWFPSLVIAGWKAIRQRRFLQDPKTFYLLVWLIPGWFFYELQLSKLPSYALGAYGAFAIALALFLGKERQHNTIGLIFQTFLLSVISIAIVVVGLFVLRITNKDPYNIAFAFAGIGIAIFPARLAFANLNFLRKLPNATLPTADNYLKQIAIMLALIPVFMHQLDGLRGITKTIAYKIAADFKTNEAPLLLGANLSQPSLPFYLSVNHVPYIYIEDKAQINVYLNNAVSNYLTVRMVCDKDKYQQLKDLNILKGAKIDSLAGFVTDRSGSSNYWIVSVVKPLE